MGIPDEQGISRPDLEKGIPLSCIVLKVRYAVKQRRLKTMRRATEHWGCTAGNWWVTIVSKVPSRLSFPP